MSATRWQQKILSSQRVLASAAALVVGAICAYVYWYGRGSLYLSHWNAQLAASIREFQFDSSESTFGTFWSPLEGLGQRSLESPTWLNLSYTHMLFTGGRFNETLFGLTIGILIYLSSFFLARRLRLGSTQAILAGVISVFVLFLPSPFMWQRQSGQSGGLIVLAIAVPLSLALVNDSRLGRTHRRSNLIAFGLVVFLFTYSFGIGSALFLISLIIGGLPTVIRQLLQSRAEVRWALYKCVVFMLAVSPQVVPQLAFISLHRQSDQVAPASSAWLDAVSGYWGDLAAVFPWYRLVVLTVLVSLFVLGITQESHREVAILGILSVGIPFVLLLLTVFGIRQGVGELFPSSSYFLIGLAPLAITAAVSIAAGLISRVALAYLPKMIRKWLVITGLLVWAALWSIDNRALRSQEVSLTVERSKSIELVQPIIDDLYCTLRLLSSTNVSQSFCGRVLLVDSERQMSGAAPRRDPLWVSALYAPLALHGVPVVNSYGSRYSGPYYQFTNRAFTDGSQSIRAWVPYNRYNSDVARLYGVRVVIADRKIPGLVDPREFDVTDSEGNKTRLYHYQVSETNTNGIAVSRVLVAASFSQIIERIGAQQGDLSVAYDIITSASQTAVLSAPTNFSIGVGVSEVSVSGNSPGTSIMLLPFEYSSCLRFLGETGSEASLIRLNGIQLALQFRGKIEGSIGLVDRGIGLRSCWSDDLASKSVMQ